jgi:hypothetical protein
MSEILGYAADELVAGHFSTPWIRRRAPTPRYVLLISGRASAKTTTCSSGEKTDPKCGPFCPPLRFSKNGYYVGSLVMMLDVTERRQLENNLRQAQKMDARLGDGSVT